VLPSLAPSPRKQFAVDDLSPGHAASGVNRKCEVDHAARPSWHPTEKESRRLASSVDKEIKPGVPRRKVVIVDEAVCVRNGGAVKRRSGGGKQQQRSRSRKLGFGFLPCETDRILAEIRDRPACLAEGPHRDKGGIIQDRKLAVRKNGNCVTCECVTTEAPGNGRIRGTRCRDMPSPVHGVQNTIAKLLSVHWNHVFPVRAVRHRRSVQLDGEPARALPARRGFTMSASC